MKIRFKGLIICVISYLLAGISFAAPINDPLPSWQEGAVKKNMIAFVKAVTNSSSSAFVAPDERVATIDNDGTLWVEQPAYTQLVFAFDRIKTLAPQHPEWKMQEPFHSVLTNHYVDLSSKDIEKIMAITHSGMSVEDFQLIVQKWLKSAVNLHFKRHYTQLIYQPMLEVIRYLQKNNFAVYIVTGGGQDFVRAFSKETYGIPVDRVIGTASKTKYIYAATKPELIKQPDILFIDDHQGKPEAINLIIGKRPIIAFGNSIGDQQMLEWTQAGSGKRLMLLVHHDDAAREYAYDTQSKIGTFSLALMQEAKKNNWQVISMKNDWKIIFPIVK